MKKMRKLTIAVTVFALLSSVAIFHRPVYAQETTTDETTTTTRAEAATERAEAARQAREARVLERCDRLKTNLEIATTRTGTIVDRRTNIFQRIQTNLGKAITYADQQAYDTTALVAAQKQLTSDVEAFTQATSQLESSLVTAAEVSCEEDATPYGDAITAAREQLASVRLASATAHATIQDDVLPALQDFATWLKENK